MISGVLQLAERPIRSAMTPRAEVDYIDLADSAGSKVAMVQDQVLDGTCADG